MRAGIGLRGPHAAAFEAERPEIGWVEVHAENYMGGGPAPRMLERVRRDYPVSLHGVGLSLGSAEGIDADHLAALARAVRRFEPLLVSEHLAWSVAGGTYLNDLLPLPYTEEALAVVSDNVRRAQDALARQILVENPAAYLRFRHSPIPEAEFLAEVVRRTGCSLLCDVNNIHVSLSNLGGSAVDYLSMLPPEAVGEIHVAGHFRRETEGRVLLIDDHAAPVADPVWQLHAQALRLFGPKPTLVEWDNDLPALRVLVEEARKADRILEGIAERHAIPA